MLPRKNRIPRKDFPSPKERGSRVFNPFFTAVFYKTETIGVESRVSVVVSKKTAKTAVIRNKLRRRFYDLLSPYFRMMTTPTTAVIYPKKEAIEAQFSILNEEVKKALKQAKLVN